MKKLMLLVMSFALLSNAAYAKWFCHAEGCGIYCHNDSTGAIFDYNWCTKEVIQSTARVSSPVKLGNPNADAELKTELDRVIRLVNVRKTSRAAPTGAN